MIILHNIYSIIVLINFIILTYDHTIHLKMNHFKRYVVSDGHCTYEMDSVNCTITRFNVFINCDNSSTVLSYDKLILKADADRS